jgi:nucleotide-binding universal stress UspA family protein
MYKRILVAIDDSTPSTRALQVALQLAALRGSALMELKPMQGHQA